MYENMTYETILQRMIDKAIEKDPNADIREGSIIYNALAPAAVELQNAYIELDVVLDEAFADTQSRKYLIKRAAERGITPDLAQKAIVKGIFSIDVPIGSRFSLDDFNYVVIEQISVGEFELECETAGEGGNKLGSIIPVEYIAGLTSAEITEILIPGEEEEDTEVFRKRYFASFDSEAFGGNEADYKKKTGKLPGVGGVKVYRAWNGGGTVKLVITDSNYDVPSSALIDSVQTAADPVVNSGEGKGFAPIDHVVTVEGAVSTLVEIVTNITYEPGWSWVDIEPYANEMIDGYFKELAKTWADEKNLIVRISQIETRFLNLQGVIDISGTTINSLAQNLMLDANNIPVRGVISG